MEDRQWGKKLSGRTIGTEARVDFRSACGTGRIVANRVWTKNLETHSNLTRDVVVVEGEKIARERHSSFNWSVWILFSPTLHKAFAQAAAELE